MFRLVLDKIFQSKMVYLMVLVGLTTKRSWENQKQTYKNQIVIEGMA